MHYLWRHITLFGLVAVLPLFWLQGSWAAGDQAKGEQTDQVVYLSHNQYGEPVFSDVAHPEAQHIRLPKTQAYALAAINQDTRSVRAASQVELMLQVADDLAAARRARDAERDQRRKTREVQRQSALQAQARASDAYERTGYYYPLGFPHRVKRPHSGYDDNYGHGYSHNGTVDRPRSGRDGTAPREQLRARFR